MRQPKFFPILVAVLSLLLLALAMPAAAQDYQIAEVDVNLTCGNITVTVFSNDDDTTETQVLVKTAGYVGWNLLGDIDNYIVVGPRGEGTRTYDFVDQPANRLLSYSVRVMDAETNLVVYVEEATRNCSGETQPSGSGSSNPTVATNGGAPFAITCTAEGGVFVQPVDGGTALTATPLQIAQGFVDAASSGQNTMIARLGSISIWALTTQELQVAYRAGLNEFDTIFPITQCGGINAASLAQVTPSPQDTSGETTTTTTTSAPANVTSNASCTTPTGARTTHIVQPGENLFRIGLRYGVPYPQLAAYNGISDPTRIFVGQCIIIP